MPRMSRAVPYLGYVTVSGVKLHRGRSYVPNHD
jgi:hypothetical protein